MTEIETINGWTFEETIQTTENLMEVENNVFKWDVLRHLRDFAESFKDELEQYRAIGTIEEFKALKEKSMAKKVVRQGYAFLCPECKRSTLDGMGLKSDCCPKCGQKLDWQ